VADAALHLVVRTPRETVAELALRSLRVPTHTGQVGLRPRSEPAALAVEPGLILAQGDAGTRFLASAGGLLHGDGERVVLLTPLAVVGDDARGVSDALAAALASPDADLELRRAIERLQTGILQELRRSAGAAAPELVP
jgi:F0F1-type ATP synthase epsilon subunit